MAWLKIARLQFYLMTWIAYTVGALLASKISGVWLPGVYFLGYALLFVMELCTVLANELYDYETDKKNRNFGPFTGGSRVLVEETLSRSEVKKGFTFFCVISFLLAIMLVQINPGIDAWRIWFFYFIGISLGLGYTMPPLKFCYQGLGELVVGFTHSFYVMLCGYLFQSGRFLDSPPWLVGLPLFFSTLTAIILADLPDMKSDGSSGKKTLAVILGGKKASLVAAFMVPAAVVSFSLFGKGLGAVLFAINLHGAFLFLAILKIVKTGDFDRRIDGALILSLTFILWFGMIPLVQLLERN